MQPTTGQDGSLWYSLGADGTEAGCDLRTYTAAYKRPGGPVTPLPLAGAFYSYAQVSSGNGQFFGGAAYTPTFGGAVRWSTTNPPDALPGAGLYVSGIASDGKAVVSDWSGHRVWYVFGGTAPLDLSHVLPGAFVWSVFGLEREPAGTYRLKCTVIDPTFGYTGVIVTGLAL